MQCYQHSLYHGQYFTPVNADRIIWQTSEDISNGSECFNKPDVLAAARAGTAPHLCLANVRTPHFLLIFSFYLFIVVLLFEKRYLILYGWNDNKVFES